MIKELLSEAADVLLVVSFGGMLTVLQVGRDERRARRAAAKSVDMRPASAYDERRKIGRRRRYIR